MASSIAMKLSKIIEKLFNKGMNAFFNEIEKAVKK